jgi:hypothetical protein
MVLDEQAAEIYQARDGSNAPCRDDTSDSQVGIWQGSLATGILVKAATE